MITLICALVPALSFAAIGTVILLARRGDTDRFYADTMRVTGNWRYFPLIVQVQRRGGWTFFVHIFTRSWVLIGRRSTARCRTSTATSSRSQPATNAPHHAGSS